MEQEISGISKKNYSLERLTEIFETNFRKLSVPFGFEPEFPKILVERNAPNVLCKSWFFRGKNSSHAHKTGSWHLLGLL